MRKSKIRSIIELIGSGWRAYNAEPEITVYTRLNCLYAPEAPKDGGKKRKSNQPFWFSRGDSFLCIGCNRVCTLFRPAGFIKPLPINYKERPGTPHTLSPAEMVRCKSLLRVDEAAYCLNISERSIYDWLAEGKLRRTEDSPIRIPAEDVAFYMNKFAE